jgi:hypothetical protein
VLRFDPRQADAEPEVVLGDDGSGISAGTVAAAWRDQFLVGTLFDPKVMLCTASP